MCQCWGKKLGLSFNGKPEHYNAVVCILGNEYKTFIIFWIQSCVFVFSEIHYTPQTQNCFKTCNK